MADENKELFDNPASDETPPEPTDEAKTEEQWETVAGPDEKDDQEQKAAKKEEEPAQDEKSDAFWRRERDQLLSAAKADHPQWTQDFLAKRRQERKQEPTPTVEDIAQGKVAETGDEQEFATKADIKTLLGEVRSEIKRERKEKDEEREQEQFEDEYQRVNGALVAFREKHSISNEDHDKISAEAASFGADLETLGGPSAFVRAYGKVATSFLQERQGNQQQQTATSEAEQKALAAKMTMQPSGSAIGMQPKRELTKEEKILDKMHAANSSDAAEEVFK